MVLRFFLFAITFLFISCADFERDNPEDERSKNYRAPSSSSATSSSSADAPLSSVTVPSSSSSTVVVPLSSSSSKPSSSSSVPSSSSATSSSSAVIATLSSSSSNEKYGSVKDDGGITYTTVVIGTQTWMAENLNYNVGDSKCYNNDTIYCGTYGRLYDWATAMQLDASCNSTSCKVDAKHRGVCPADWHIPSSADWDKLYRYVDGDKGTTSPYGSLTAGKYLKATSGWNNDKNGEDKYGFSALPGGAISGSSQNLGVAGYWWSASEIIYGSFAGLKVNARSMGTGDGADQSDADKTHLYSVRCVKD